MEVRCFLYSCMLLLGLGGEVVSAQTFRRIKNVRELEDGAHYVLAGYCAAHPDSLYVEEPEPEPEEPEEPEKPEEPEEPEEPEPTPDPDPEPGPIQKDTIIIDSQPGHIEGGRSIGHK